MLRCRAANSTPPTPANAAPIANAISFDWTRFTPIDWAMLSSLLIALHARPVRDCFRRAEKNAIMAAPKSTRYSSERYVAGPEMPSGSGRGI